MEGEQRGIGPAPLQEFRVAAGFRQTAIDEQQNAIGRLDGRKPMAHDDRGFALAAGHDRRQQFPLCPGIEGTGRFVQHQDRSLAQKDPGQSQPLPLALAEFRAARKQPPQLGLQALRQARFPLWGEAFRPEATVPDAETTRLHGEASLHAARDAPGPR